MRQIIRTPNAPAAVGPYAQAIRFGNLLFISGQIPLDPASGTVVAGDIAVQTRRVMENLKAVAAAAGMGLQDALKCTCFLKSMDDFAAFNAVYGEYLGEVLPARETVEVVRLPKDVLVEVSVICGK